MPTNVLIPNVSIDERIGSVFNYLFHIINDSEKSEDETVEWNFKTPLSFIRFSLRRWLYINIDVGRKYIV